MVPHRNFQELIINKVGTSRRPRTYEILESIKLAEITRFACLASRVFSQMEEVKAPPAPFLINGNRAFSARLVSNNYFFCGTPTQASLLPHAQGEGTALECHAS